MPVKFVGSAGRKQLKAVLEDLRCKVGKQTEPARRKVVERAIAKIAGVLKSHDFKKAVVARVPTGPTRCDPAEEKSDSSSFFKPTGIVCKQCGRSGTLRRDMRRSMRVCDVCGCTESYMDCSFSSCGYDVDYEFTNFSYRRITHFTEWLSSVQGKEAFTPTKEQLEAVMGQLWRDGKEKTADISTADVRKALKKLRMTKLYENSPSIHARITGIQPPRFSSEEERLLKTMFFRIQTAFDKAKSQVCPERKNFLSYSFCLYKFAELLGLPYMHLFRLLKGREKLRQQDAIWEKICDSIGWVYYPTIYRA